MTNHKWFKNKCLRCKLERKSKSVRTMLKKDGEFAGYAHGQYFEYSQNNVILDVRPNCIRQ